MKEFQSVYFSNRKDFRDWLKKNYNSYSGLWLVFYKKGASIKNITYDDAVEEALCFGWIDSIVKRIDEEKYVRKFTPRTNNSNWSVSNKKRVLKLIEEGKMTKPGLNKIDFYLNTGKVDWTEDNLLDKNPCKLNIPDFMVKNLKKQEPAFQNFTALAPSYKKHYIDWITTAKKEETTVRRLKKSVELLKRIKNYFDITI
ncbi:MAG: YdeI/OmpD-associated family protein [Bacteroidetes bacterium]|nr:YdeI/OmpD-associated family protein [Bacteroidota bacterium]MBL6944692.1 YdeI/OmpD-associated family protein [Bacteroidales bacterium]